MRSRLLGLSVVQIGKIEVPVFRAGFHVLKRISHVGIAHFVEQNGIGVIGLDGYYSDALVLVLFRNLLDSCLVKLGRRAVIADECDHQHLASGVVLQTMSLAIYPGQTEVGCRRADRQGRVLAFSRDGTRAEQHLGEKAQQYEKDARLEIRPGCRATTVIRIAREYRSIRFACVCHHGDSSEFSN